MMELSGWGAAGAFAMMVGMFALVAVAVAGLMLLFRPVFGSRAHREDRGWEPQAESESSPLGILEDRYARGEIDREEFLERRLQLTGLHQGGGEARPSAG